MTKAMLFPRNGSEFPWIAKRTAKFIDQLGHNRVTHRCDNEPATSADGMTPLHRLHGRRDNTPIPEFGVKILYNLAKPAGGGKWEPRFYPGVFAGLLKASLKAEVATDQGLALKIRAANVRRIPDSECWDGGSNSCNASSSVVSR